MSLQICVQENSCAEEITYYWGVAIMSSSMKPVKKRNDEKAAVARKQQEAKQKGELKQKMESEKADTAGRMSLKRKVVTSKTFLLGNSVADQAPVVATMENDEEMSKFTSKFTYSQPLLLTNSDTIKSVVDMKTDKDTAGFWLAKWHLYIRIVLLPTRCTQCLGADDVLWTTLGLFICLFVRMNYMCFEHALRSDSLL